MTRPSANDGFAYVEVLVAVFLTVLLLVPALEALQTGLVAAGLQEQLLTEQHHLASRMEELLVEPFDDLDTEAQSVGDPTAPTSYSDAAGDPMRRIVYLARYDGDDDDGDPFTGGDEDLLWVRVTLENSHRELETLRVR